MLWIARPASPSVILTVGEDRGEAEGRGGDCRGVSQRSECPRMQHAHVSEMPTRRDDIAISAIAILNAYGMLCGAVGEWLTWPRAQSEPLGHVFDFLTSFAREARKDTA